MLPPMQPDHSFMQLFSLVQGIVQKKTAPGTGFEYGITIDGIKHEAQMILGPYQQISQQDVLHVLMHRVGDVPVFESIRRPDGIVLWRLYQHNAMPPMMHQRQPQQAPVVFEQATEAPLPFVYEQAPPDGVPSISTIEELEEEVKQLQKTKKELLAINERLKLCNYMMRQPQYLDENSTKLDSAIFSMRDTYTMIDERINNLLDFLNVELSDKK